MLNVWYGTERVGELTQEDRVLRFQYAPEWLARPGGFYLSPQLPLGKTPYSGDAVVIFFSNLLPEGPVLSALLKLKRLPAGDIYTQLKALGEDAAGAFAVGASGTTASRNPHYVPYPVEEICRDINGMEKNLPLLAAHGKLRLSLAGAQNKITVLYRDGNFWLPAEGSASTHILKPAIVPAFLFKHSVQNEALCMHLAQACGLPTAEVQVVEIDGSALLVKRFDREPEGQPDDDGHARLRRLHQLDFCQLAGVLPDQKYEQEGGPSLRRIFELMDTYAAVPARARLAVLDWVLFNFLIGNADAHAKNLAMLVGSGEKLTLAPFYDMLSTAVYPDLEKRTAMAIGGEYRPDWMRAKNWSRFAAEAGVNPRLLKRRATALAQRVEATLDTMAELLAGDAGGAGYNWIVTNLSVLIRKRASHLEVHLAKV